MSLIPLLAQYGYLAVFLGSLLEGETILILAGFAAHRGYLSFPLVVALACLGGTLGDQLFFFLGRRGGARLLARFPRLAARALPVQQLIQRYHTGLIVMVRFMYGLRTIGPCVIGMSDVPAWRFTLLNLLGAAVWAPLVAGLGYLFGETLQWLLADFKRYEEAGLLLIIAAVGLLHLLRHFRARRKAQR